MLQDQSPLLAGMQLTAFGPIFRNGMPDQIEELGELFPIHRDEQIDRIVVTIAKDIQALLRDPRFSHDPSSVPKLRELANGLIGDLITDRG
jgi:hypothetical protein